MDVSEVVLLLFIIYACIALCGCVSNRQGTDTAGAASGELLERDQQDIRGHIDRVGDSTAELANGIEQSVKTVDNAEEGIISATGYSGEVAVGINDSLFIAGEIGEGLGELETILRELEKRTGFTSGLGDEEGNMD
jgi:hypothetical protein